MDFLTKIAAAFAAGTVKRITESGYSTTDLILKKMASLASRKSSANEVFLTKSRDVPKLLGALQAAELDEDTLLELMNLSNDLLSSLSPNSRLELIARSNVDAFREAFEDVAYVSPLFSKNIEAVFDRIDKSVDCLTAEQHRVMRVTEPLRQAHITGSPGSGKTLVAAEKAIRLTYGGNRVIVLCHSPNLKRHIEELVGTSGVVVFSVIELVAFLLGENQTPDWSHYHNVTSDQIDMARKEIEKKNIEFEAVLIDEAQDFDKAWWSVVESLRSSSDGHLYIFSDERQALIPSRGGYPDVPTVIDISRNCRNAGAVFEYMRQFDGTLPVTEPLLQDLGVVDGQKSADSVERNLERGLRSAENYNLLEKTAVLYGNGYESWFEKLDGTIIRVDDAHLSSWRSLILKLVQHLVEKSSKAYGPGMKFSVSVLARRRIGSLAKRLSFETVPNHEDKALIASALRGVRFKVPEEHVGRLHISERPHGFNINHYGDLSLQGLSFGGSYDIGDFATLKATVELFSSTNWELNLGKNFEVKLTKGKVPGAGSTVSLYRIEDFKGLEADCVLLFPDRYSSEGSSNRSLVGASRASKVLVVFEVN